MRLAGAPKPAGSGPENATYAETRDGDREPGSDRHGSGSSSDVAAGLEPAALYRLMTWLSPAYPVGAFAYSSGIEWAVQAGDIADAETLLAWLVTMLTRGSGINDAILFAHAHRAVTLGDNTALLGVAELAAALVPTRERYQETTTLGRAFVEVTIKAWPCSALAELQELRAGPPAYSVAVAAACAGHAIPLAPALYALLTSLCANWVSAGVRLIPLGHSDGQHVLNAIESTVAATAERALHATLDDLGGASFRADLASALHESQYTRLFRS
jgi:urease accessory protein